MATFQVILFILIFLSMALAMFFRKIPALIALPIMAFLIPLVGGVSVTDTVQYVIGMGATKLHMAYTVAIFGSMLSVLMQKTKVAENFIKIGAELSGDNPWIISVIMFLLIAALYTTLGGLGAVIMTGTIILPILSSIGVGPMTAIGIFLFGFSVGGILNVGNWAAYVDVLGMQVSQIRPFALIMFVLAFLVALVYITIQLYRDGHQIDFKRIIIRGLIVAGVIGLLIFGYTLASSSIQDVIKSIFQYAGLGFKILVGMGLAFIFLMSVYQKFIRRRKIQKGDSIYWPAYFTPIIPLLLILIFNMRFIAAFVCGLLYGFVTTFKKGGLNLFLKSVFEGGGVVMPAVVMFFGIGMLLNAIMGPGEVWAANHPEGWPVLNLLRPVMTKIISDNPFQYIIIFSLAAPLALYRGPLNIWGMGYGVAAVLMASGLNSGAVMGLLMSVGAVQGISDPTNTHNVWLANEKQQNVQKVLKNTIPYSWSLAALGLIAAALYFL